MERHSAAAHLDLVSVFSLWRKFLCRFPLQQVSASHTLCVSVTLSRKKKTMKLSRALSDLVKYTCSVGLYDIEAQGETDTHCFAHPRLKCSLNFNSKKFFKT